MAPLLLQVSANNNNKKIELCNAESTKDSYYTFIK